MRGCGLRNRGRVAGMMKLDDVGAGSTVEDNGYFKVERW